MDGPLARLAEFFAAEVSARFCAACIAFEMDASLSEARAMLRDMAAEIVVGHGASECSRCGRLALVYGLARSSAQTPDAIVALLQPLDGAGVCHTCLARKLDTPFEVVEKGVWQLRADRRVVVGPATCVQCQRPRVVVMPMRSLSEPTG